MIQSIYDSINSPIIPFSFNTGCVITVTIGLNKPPGEGGGRGGGTSYVGQYGMLGYTWVIFEKFSVLFPRDGYLFSTKFLYFFCKVGIYFKEKILYLSNKMEPIYTKFSVFYSIKLLHFTHKISVYFYMMSIFSRDLL